MNIEIKNEDFGPLQHYVEDASVTDINWNGTDLWINHGLTGRFKDEQIVLDNSFLVKLSNHISNLVNENFNRIDQILEAETPELRIEIVHPSATDGNIILSIRKTPKERKIKNDAFGKNKYCTKVYDKIIGHCVKAHCNFAIIGIPGAGKTERVKYLTKFIPDYERVITVEDNFEIRYRDINPGKDCVPIKVNDNLSYSDAIKASMRLLPQWLLLSEARSVEAKQLLESLSTGVSGMTTLHTDDIFKVPDRIQNMIGENSEDIKNNIFSFIDIVELVTETQGEDGVKRHIEQAAFFSRQGNKNKIIPFYENETLLIDELPSEIARKFMLKNIEDPFKNMECNQEVEEI